MRKLILAVYIPLFLLEGYGWIIDDVEVLVQAVE